MVSEAGVGGQRPLSGLTSAFKMHLKGRCHLRQPQRFRAPSSPVFPAAIGWAPALSFTLPPNNYSEEGDLGEGDDSELLRQRTPGFQLGSADCRSPGFCGNPKAQEI